MQVHRHGSDPVLLLWLPCRPAAVAPIRPLAWELSYEAGAALKNKNQTKSNKKKVVEQRFESLSSFRATTSPKNTCMKAFCSVHRQCLIAFFFLPNFLLALKHKFYCKFQASDLFIYRNHVAHCTHIMALSTESPL